MATGDLPVVVIPGLISSRYLRRAVPLLGRSFDVRVIDPPGYGRRRGRVPPSVDATARAIATDLADMGLDRVDVVGTSFGCQVGLALAAARPALVRRLVLQGPPVDAHARGFLAQVRRFVRDVLHEHPLILPVALLGSLRTGLRNTLISFRVTLADRPEARLPHVAAPTLVLRGSRDAAVSRPWCEQLVHGLPDGRLVEIAGGPHGLPYAMPRAFAAAVERFLSADLSSQR